MHFVCAALERYVPVILNMKTVSLCPCLHGNALRPKYSLGQIARAFHLTVVLRVFFHARNKFLESCYWDQRFLDRLQPQCVHWVLKNAFLMILGLSYTHIRTAIIIVIWIILRNGLKCLSQQFWLAVSKRREIELVKNVGMQKNIVCVPKPITSLEYLTVDSMMLQYFLLGLLVGLRTTVPACSLLFICW